MNHSCYYLNLISRISDLTSSLLPKEFSPIGDYSSKELDMTEVISYLFMQRSRSTLKR